MKIGVIKQMNGSLLPANNSDYELAKKLKVGEQYQAEIKKPRNYKFLQKFFALLSLVYENQEIYDNKEFMREELTKAAGYFDMYLNHKNVECYKAKSISFASMSQDEFDELYKRFCDVIVKYFDFDEETIEENIQEFM
jgi:hypothetical protein